MLTISLTLIHVNTYTDSGQLMCVLCKTVVRSETVWPVHLNSKVHKENIALAKKTKLEVKEDKPTSNVTTTFKRPHSPTEETSDKKIKGILKNSTQPTLVQTKLSLPVDFFDNSNSKQVNGSKPIVPFTPIQESKNITTVGATEAEGCIEAEKEKEKATDKAKDSNLAALPEGFFDDPVMDAKVEQQLETYIWRRDFFSLIISFFMFVFVFRFVMSSTKIPLKRNMRNFKKKLRKRRHNPRKLLLMIKRKLRQRDNWMKLRSKSDVGPGKSKLSILNY